MHPACEECGGACCKGMILDLRKGMNGDEKRWLGLHGYDENGRVKFDQPCLKLEDGKCSIYETRPGICRTMKVGSRECLYAIHTWAPEKYSVVVSKIQFQNRGPDGSKLIKP